MKVQPTLSSSTRKARFSGVVHDSPPSVQESWDNHFAAFGGQDVDRILFDYTEDSEIIGYDQTSGGKTVSTDLPASAIASPVFSLACPTQVTLLARRRGKLPRQWPARQCVPLSRHIDT